MIFLKVGPSFRGVSWIIAGMILLTTCWRLSKVEAAARKQSNPAASLDGKKILEIIPVPDIQIELPNQVFHHWGEDFQSKLITRLVETGKYRVLTPAMPRVSGGVIDSGDSFQWTGTSTPSLRLRVEIDALDFITGKLGDRMFYGFDERLRTTFNAGDGKFKNEFPLKESSSKPNWFGNTFDATGTAPFDSRSGLDLGDGFQLKFLFAWLTVKYAEYQSDLHLKLYLSHPISSNGLFSPEEFHEIQVHGKGFFFDVAGAYQGYSVGIVAARRDAMLQVLNRSIQGTFDAIQRALDSEPLMAKVDEVLPNGTVLLGTGPYSGVRPGILYSILEIPEITFQVLNSGESGSVSRIVSGDIAQVRPEMLVRQTHEMIRPRSLASTLNGVSSLIGSSVSGETIPVASETVTLPSDQLPQIILPMPDLTEWSPVLSEAKAFLISLTQAIFLPYRIVRYFLYDQKLHSRPDFAIQPWMDQLTSWEKQIGLDRAPEMKSNPVVVAVIDSGVDYNHPYLHSSLWQVGNEYGWDFISNDARAYDDQGHGTRLASLVVKVAPRVKILPIKVFNPWGITTSASLLAAFQYAVNHGAQIILCGWATPVASKAIEQGVAYAKEHQVIVVTAAGDQGWSLEHLLEYPADLAHRFDTVLVVAGVDTQDRLIKVQNYSSNFGPRDVQIAAPGESLVVAEPRASQTIASSTSLAASITAGVLARYIADPQIKERGSDLIRVLLKDADSISSLRESVQDGLRLKIRR